MRRLALLLLLASCTDDAPPEKPRPPAPPPIDPKLKWVSTQARDMDLRVSVPEEWSTNSAVRPGEIHFGGPGEPGRKPELIFGWKPGNATPESEFSKFENSPLHKVVRKGPATVAGMPGAYCVFDTGATRHILYRFCGHGCEGFVRGVAPIAEFARYAPIFEEAAARVRYSPP